ncbi:hypothetical protein B0T25DRAFT_565972 [Lasiosphaeria hispida]|uniref:Uncharacterized protein n=1 Tax=Lasiosphaeria hispida TaxID=260671 RepID=A0AAJ0HL48_9PEZI|nr:hypothetical protein B0T25DRAFT_565972 [Lasiosphaeria hispida]
MTGADGMIHGADKMMQYSPTPNLSAMMDFQGAAIYRIHDSQPLFYDVEGLFEVYRQDYNFDNIPSELQVYEKERNNIVDKWPLRLKLQLGQEGAQEEFDVMLGSHFSRVERYV